MNELFKDIKSVSDIVDLMVRGLKKEWVSVDMRTYGTSVDGICYGCAATNALCELMGKPFDANNIIHRDDRLSIVNHGLEWKDLYSFENAIDSLRDGYLYGFRRHLIQIEGLFQFKIPNISDLQPPFRLPPLYDDIWRRRLSIYENYRDWLREKGL